jgi:GT2 family glycosyltransferase
MRAARRNGADGGAIPTEQIEERLEYVKRVFESIDLFVAPSPHLAAEYRRLGLRAEKLRVSDYGFVRFAPAGRERSPDRLRIGFVGTLVWHKGAHILLEAVRSLPPNRFEVLIFGDTNTFQDYSAALRQQARGLPVRFLGRFERDRVPEVYASFDVLVIPSLWPENSPLVIHEAFMAGVPVVGSRLGGTQDLVTHGVSGLLYDAFSPAALAEALRSLIDEPGLVKKLAAAAPEVKSMQQDAAGFVDIYSELLNTHAPAPAATLRSRTTGVLVSYGSSDDMMLTLQSMQASRRPFWKVIVVDSGLPEGSAPLLRDGTAAARLRPDDRNLGFSGRCNLGVRSALAEGAERILILKGGAILPPGALQHLEDALDANPRLGIVSPVIVSRQDPSIVISRGLRYWRSTGRIRHIIGDRVENSSAAGPAIVDAVSGCAMLVRREVFDKIGLLGEDYFFGFEDIDFCFRARAAGFETACVDQAAALDGGDTPIGPEPSSRIYFATRNHLLLTSRLTAGRFRPLAWIHAVGALSFNLAQAVLAPDVATGEGLRGSLRGAADHLRGRYGSPRQRT